MEEKRMPFGKKLKCGNFLVLKYTKTLSKGEMKRMRHDVGIPVDVQKHLQRGGLPYIKVEALSGIWAVEYCCNTQLFMVIDKLLPLAIEAAEKNETAATSLADFAHLFSMMMADTMVLGDDAYMKAKALAMKELIERQKAVEVSKEDDDKMLDGLRTEEEAKTVVVEMAKEVATGSQHTEPSN